MNPFFSIIIPTYNSSATISVALNSIIKQSYQNFEVIIVDGLSNDNTISIISQFQDDRIKIFSEKDKGVYDAMNKGINYANGKWIYFMGSDDYFYDNTILFYISNKLKWTSKNVLYGNVLIKGDTGWAKDGKIYNGKFSFQKLLRGNICHQSMFYRHKFIIKNKLEYNLRYVVSADWDYNIRCRLITSFVYVNKIIAVFNAGGLSTGKNSTEYNTNEIIDKYKYLYESNSSIKYRIKRYLIDLAKKLKFKSNTNKVI